VIGSRTWLVEVELEYQRRGWTFDPVKAYRREVVREIAALRPRRWVGEMPWVLHDHEDRSALNPRFVAYLDAQLGLHTWEERLHAMKHQDLNWWQDRLKEVTDNEVLTV